MYFKDSDDLQLLNYKLREIVSKNFINLKYSNYVLFRCSRKSRITCKSPLARKCLINDPRPLTNNYNPKKVHDTNNHVSSPLPSTRTTSKPTSSKTSFTVFSSLRSTDSTQTTPGTSTNLSKNNHPISQSFFEPAK